MINNLEMGYYDNGYECCNTHCETVYRTCFTCMR